MNKRQVGREQEERAAVFLEEQGYRIIQRNYNCRVGEIDLIASHQGYLVFVEVKYRSRNRSGYPEEAVDVKKQRRISRAASWYLMEQGLSMDTPCRFDVAAVTPEEIHIYQDAFFYQG